VGEFFITKLLHSNSLLWLLRSAILILMFKRLAPLRTPSQFKKTAPPFQRLYHHLSKVIVYACFLILLVVVGAEAWYLRQMYLESVGKSEQISLGLGRESALGAQLAEVEEKLASAAAELLAVKAEDQFVTNRALEAEIRSIQLTYKDAVNTYNLLLDLKEDTTQAQTQALDADFAATLNFLSQRNYASASTRLNVLKQGIQKKRAELASAAGAVPANVPTNNAPPDSGYRRQAVETEFGKFVVDMVAADLSSTRVVVETASGGDCGDNCPVSSLADFVSKAGGFAGINGPYFCPAEYPSCAGKKNSFDTLLMNKNKTYFNSDNNVYSNVPAVIFSGGSARFVGASQEWGRDTGVDSVIASQPMLLSGGEVRFGGDGDPKKGSRGSRSFIGNKGGKVYIGVVRSATVAEVARVLKVLGLENALNLDSGGSTAMMANGRYVAGPGRNTPFGIVLVRR
jgi:hypothetical protein